MTDHPYTDDDLRAEAARQHATLAEDPDYVGVGEQMDDRFVHYEVVDAEHGDLMPPPGTPRWNDLSEDEFDEAQQKIHDLINGAADVSEWAVNLGADNLQPSTEHAITLNAGRPIARIHFAFEPDMPEEMRTALVEGIGDAINEAGAEPEPVDDTDDEPADSDSDVFDLISEIASRLRDATDSGEYHAVGLIYDLAMSRTTVAEARAELAGIEFGHV
ncbi:hypothetical protein [Streptomyces sp. NPDC005549]|uniref:hypothetical protein n=1 Tax=Streptomyces sp. NPDC005549 TaxID=3154888 RepID=UPI0033B708AD